MSSRALAALVACVAVAASAPPAAAAPASWQQLARGIADPWPALQTRSGHFGDYVRDRAGGAGRDDYGDAMLGYALLQVGLREDDQRPVRSGLRAVTYAARHPSSEAIRMYQSLGIASAYNLARRKLVGDDRFEAVRRTWEKRLRRIRILTLHEHRVVWSHAMAEAVEVLELTRSGLHSSDPQTVLHDPKAAARRARRLFNRDMPDAAERTERSDPRAGPTAVLGEFTRGLPIAYHALGLGMLARGVELMGPGASSRARATLRAAASASWALQSPDGDVAYFGRSQAQSWTLALTAYGSGVAAATPGASDAAAARWRAVAARAVDRLADAYPVRDIGLLITPALARNLGGGIHGLDDYVAAVSYNGLTLAALNWAIAAAGPAGGGEIGADTPGSFVVGKGQTAFATVRTPDVWFVVKEARTEPGDLRYDFGLVALKVRDGSGGWRDLMPVRPITHGDADTAGPVLIRGGHVGAAKGDTLHVGSGGKVIVRGGFRDGGSWLRHGVRFVFEPRDCGVRLSLPVRKNDRLDYSGFLRHGNPQATEFGLSEPGQLVSSNSPFTHSLGGGYSSGMDPRITRARMRWTPPSNGRLTITVCRPDAS
ncbi:MAG: hypothetical protein QOG86_330 [Thermoleophilaceae bacterium]|nr:hypothetical protein [Thermoleophilaceae bacterium]